MYRARAATDSRPVASLCPSIRASKYIVAYSRDQRTLSLVIINSHEFNYWTSENLRHTGKKRTPPHGVRSAVESLGQAGLALQGVPGFEASARAYAGVRVEACWPMVCSPAKDRILIFMHRTKIFNMGGFLGFKLVMNLTT